MKFGDVPMEALTMTTYAPDSSAEAVVLMDYGVSSIEYNQSTGFELIFDRIRRIKILKEGGKQWADFGVSLYKDSDQSEKLVQFRGVTVNLEKGKAVESKLSNDGIFREKFSKNIDRVKVTLPNVKVGSVLDISYRVKSDFLVNFQDWDFQATIPVVWSEYRAEIPEYFVYDKYMQGYLAISVNESATSQGKIVITSMERGEGRVATSTPQRDEIDYKLEKFRWVVKDAPAFKDEPYLTTRNDYISRMNFELATIIMPGQPLKQVLGSWEEINNRYSESSDFLGEVTGNGFLRKTAEEVTAGATTVPQKVDAICSYVKRNVAWDGTNRSATEKSLKQTIEDKKGNSAEINLLIASMLEKLGINVKPVLLSTREHGFVREATPASSQFNYVIALARWETSQVLLDGTNGYLPTRYLPERCLNGKGMAVSKEGPEWVKLDAPAKSRSVVNSDLQLSPDGVLSGQIKLEHYGYEAAEKRQKYLSPSGKDAYVKEIVGERPWQVSNSEFTNERNLAEGFKEKHDVQINEHISVAGDVLYMNPFVIGQLSSNPFKLEKREYPVDFGTPFDEVYVIKVKLPEGYVVDEMPAAKMFLLPGNAARYTLSAAINGNALTVTSMLSVNKGMFISEEYQGLREFYSQVVAKQTEQIVIKKK